MFFNSSTRSILISAVFTLLDFIGHDPGVLASPLIDLTFVPMSLHLCLEFVAASAQLSDCLLSQELLECPFLNILLLVLLQLSNELDSTLQDGAFVLFAARNDLGKFIDALIDGLATAALH